MTLTCVFACLSRNRLSGQTSSCANSNFAHSQVLTGVFCALTQMRIRLVPTGCFQSWPAQNQSELHPTRWNRSKCHRKREQWSCDGGAIHVGQQGWKQHAIIVFLLNCFVLHMFFEFRFLCREYAMPRLRIWPRSRLCLTNLVPKTMAFLQLEFWI